MNIPTPFGRKSNNIQAEPTETYFQDGRAKKQPEPNNNNNGGYTTNFVDESMPEERPANQLKSTLVLSKAKNVNQLFKSIPENKSVKIENEEQLKQIFKKSLAVEDKKSERGSGSSQFQKQLQPKDSPSKKVSRNEDINQKNGSHNR